MKSCRVVWITLRGDPVRDPIYDKMVSTLRIQRVISTHADINNYAHTHHKATLRVVKHDAIFMDFESEEDEMAWSLMWS